MRDCVGIMIAKGASLRLPGKNNRDFFGKPLYVWNLEKLLQLGIPVYFDSDSEEMLQVAENLGAHPHLRPEELRGHQVPSVPLFQRILADLELQPGAIMNLQANSPTCSLETLQSCLNALRHTTCTELLTVYEDRTNNGSVWGFSYDRLMNYGDPRVHKPDLLILDPSVDVHTEDELEAARAQQKALEADS